MAELISEHSSQHVAQEVAINQVLPCAEINIVQSPKYRVMSDNTIEGNGFRIECVKKAPENNTVTIHWAIPTANENGSALAVSDISHYEILIFGNNFVMTVTVMDGSQTAYILNGLQSGKITVMIKAIKFVNDEKYESVWSDSITVTI